jgi:hypothetical protein
MTTKPSSSRRKFLAAVGVGSVAAAAAVVTQRAGQPEPVAAVKSTPAGRGYQLTEHVRSYYRTTKI